MYFFDDVTGAVFIVCLIITSRSVSIYLSVGLDNSPLYFCTLTVSFNLSGMTDLISYSLLINCSLWSSAIILLVLAMIVVDLMVIFFLDNY